MSNKEKEVLEYLEKNMNTPISYPCNSIPDIDGDLVMYKNRIYYVNYMAGTAKRCGSVWLMKFRYFIKHIKSLCKINKK